MRNVRRATDPVLAPARAILRGFRLDTKSGPFIVVILMIIAGVLIVQIAGTSLNTIAGVLYAVTKSPTRHAGWNHRLSIVWCSWALYAGNLCANHFFRGWA